MLLKAAGFIVTTIIAVLLVVANNIGTDANQALMVAAAVLTAVLILILIALGVQRVRGRRRPPFFVGWVSSAPSPPDPAPSMTVRPSEFGRKTEWDPDRDTPRRATRVPPSVAAPSSGPTEVSLSDLPEAQQQEFSRLVNERTTKAYPPKEPEPRPARQGAALPDVFDNMRREPEREHIQRQARQVRDTYRAMARTNGIENTTGDVKRSMQERVDRLNEWLVEYRAKWSLSAVDVSGYVPEQPQVGPAWLRAMIREADLVVWQLDREAGG